MTMECSLPQRRWQWWPRNPEAVLGAARCSYSHAAFKEQSSLQSFLAVFHSTFSNCMWKAGCHDTLPCNIFAHTQRSGSDWMTHWGVCAYRRHEHTGNSGCLGQCAMYRQEMRVVHVCRAITVLIPGVFTTIISPPSYSVFGSSPAGMV